VAAGSSELFERYAKLSAGRKNVGVAREKHAKLTRRRRELTAEIDELQQREASVRNELRGLRFLQSCHKPWKRTKELQEELAELPVISTNPSEALKQFAAAEKDSAGSNQSSR
jgi:predicted  nucleic acid-binding Zn-ribbon protein